MIKTYSNTLSKEFCDHCIEKFEKDPNKKQGLIGKGQVDLEMKDSMDLAIGFFPEWKEEDKIFYDSLKPYVEQYRIDNPFPYVQFDNYFDTGYQIQRTVPGTVGYDWHHDWICVKETLGFFSMRCLTYIWYLNDIDVDGETEFKNTGDKIKPETGKLLLFPSDWTHVHRGIPPKNQTKYISTGWIYSRLLPL